MTEGVAGGGYVPKRASKVAGAAVPMRVARKALCFWAGKMVLWLERRVYEREVLVKHGNGCLGQRKRSKQLMQVIKTKSRPLRAVLGEHGELVN